jgi:hypothetical protein
MLGAWEQVEQLQHQVNDIANRVARANFTVQLDRSIDTMVSPSLTHILQSINRPINQLTNQPNDL